MPDNADEHGASDSELHTLVLPTGVTPLRRRVIWGVGVGILSERLEANLWANHVHSHWQISVAFTPARCDVKWLSPSGAEGEHQVQGCQVWIVPPGWWHAVRWFTPADGITLYVEPGRLSTAFCNSCPQISIEPLGDYVTLAPIVGELCSELRAMAQQPEASVHWKIAGAGTLLAAALVDSHVALKIEGVTAQAGLAYRILKKVQEYVSSHKSERLPIKEMAKDFGISPRHFRRVLRQVSGKCPRDLIAYLKTRNAKTLLQSGDYNVSEAAIASGFSDAAHLNRRMQGIYGSSPKAFRPRLPRTGG